LRKLYTVQSSDVLDGRSLASYFSVVVVVVVAVAVAVDVVLVVVLVEILGLDGFVEMITLFLNGFLVIITLLRLLLLFSWSKSAKMDFSVMTLGSFTEVSLLLLLL
jgi:hypothetical protein